MMIKILLFFVIISNIYAHPGCLGAIENAVQINLTARETQAISDTTLQRIIGRHMSRMQRISRIIEDHSKILHVQDELDVSLGHLVREPYFNGMSDFINIGGFFWPKDPKLLPEVFPRHPKFSETITAHEYGHSLFDETLEELSPSYRQLQEMVTRNYRPLQERHNILTQRLNHLASQINAYILSRSDDPEVYNNAVFVYLKREYDSYYAEFRDVGEALSTAEASLMPHFNDPLVSVVIGQRRAVPHNEMFADVVAVMTEPTYSPSAVFEGLFSRAETLNMPDNFVRLHRNRDFSYRDNQLLRWNGAFQGDNHGMYAPVRSWLHENILQMPMYQTDRGVACVLDNVFIGILSDLQHLARDPDSYDALNLFERNDLLIRRIEQAFEDNPLSNY